MAHRNIWQDWAKQTAWDDCLVSRVDSGGLIVKNADQYRGIHGRHNPSPEASNVGAAFREEKTGRNRSGAAT
jgi:hypothetical protein